MYTQYDSPVGTLLLCSDGEALTGLYLPCGEAGAALKVRQDELALFDRVRHWLDGYFAGKPGRIDFPLCPRGTPFQKQVWDILLTVPYGRTTTYGAIAGMLSPNMSAQAVGQAVGKNPISIIIPCHRCIGAGGKLTGYAGGLENKKWLLTHECCGFAD